LCLCMCFFVCVLSTVGASYVGCPIRVCAVSAPLRRVNIHLSVLPSLGLGRHRARVQAECSVGALNADSPVSNPVADTMDAPWVALHSLSAHSPDTLSKTLALVCGRELQVTSLVGRACRNTALACCKVFRTGRARARAGGAARADGCARRAWPRPRRRRCTPGLGVGL